MVDGSEGEGGGQVLRSSLALAAILGKPLRLVRIRGGRPKPGLQRQHMTCVTAAAATCAARVEGNVLNSTELLFVPTERVGLAGDCITLDIGSAGSTTLVLQTILPVLLFAERPTRVTVKGGASRMNRVYLLAQFLAPLPPPAYPVYPTQGRTTPLHPRSSTFTGASSPCLPEQALKWTSSSTGTAFIPLGVALSLQL